MFSWFGQNSSPFPNPKQLALGSAENALMQASLQHQGYMKVGEVLHLRGPYISPEALSTAVDHLQRRHPVLRSRLQINPEKPDSYLLEEDDTLRLKIREIPRKRADHLTFWSQEWREREKDVTVIDQGVAEFWLLQDPDDISNENSPREIVFICEHAACDGISLSIVANELLTALAGNDDTMFANSLSWPITMEAAIQRSLSMVGKFITLGRFISAALYLRMTNSFVTARVPLASFDFPLIDMANYCHTEASYAVLNKEETRKLMEKCHLEGVTVTSAISTALICAISTFVSATDNQPTAIHFSIAADARRRCVPPVPNHDLSFHVSSVQSFLIPTRDIPTTSEGRWQLARTFGNHMKTSIDAGQVLALGLTTGRAFQMAFRSSDFADLPTTGISSWGVLPFMEQYGKWELMAMTPFVNMIRGLMPFSTVQTVNGILTIMIVGNDPVIPLHVLENIRDVTLQKVRQMMED